MKIDIEKVEKMGGVKVFETDPDKQYLCVIDKTKLPLRHIREFAEKASFKGDIVAVLGKPDDIIAMYEIKDEKR